MANFHSYQYVPIGSLSLLPEQERIPHIESFQKSSQKIKNMLTVVKTGSYIQGMGKTHDIPDEHVPIISQIIFFIATGKKNITELAANLSRELQIPVDQAQKMAAEIEKDIFEPVKGELDDFLRGQKTDERSSITAAPAPRVAPLAPTSAKATAGRQSKPSNLLDLKEITAAKKQERLTAKPVQQSLPPRPSTGSGQAPKFPLPPRTSPPPKPPVSPLNFTNY